MGLFDGVAATSSEIAAPRPGDDRLPRADVVMDRGFGVAATPQEVWPWLVQLGKRRAGWYLPRGVERALPRSRRASRHVEPRWQGLAVGDVVPDYGGADATFTVAEIEPDRHLVYTSRRGRTEITWSIVLEPDESGGTRVLLRLRLHPVGRRWLATTVGELYDALTIAGVAAGLRERLEER
ncbi:MAG: SRPBCC domain-containing protein [Marmoricola sp.]|nr:SRPBCC domain-containing protein [Marmoricola sp.]